MSYELKIDRKARTVGRYLGMVHRALVEAAIEEKKKHKLSQRQLADRLGINVSVVNRVLRGDANLTSRTLAEFAWALGRTPEFRLVAPTKQKVGCNHLGDAQIAGGASITRTTSNAVSAPSIAQPRLTGLNAPTKVSVEAQTSYELADA